VRFVSPSFASRFRTWVSTVRSETVSRSAIARFASPSATSSATSRSPRGQRRDHVVVDAAQFPHQRGGRGQRRRHAQPPGRPGRLPGQRRRAVAVAAGVPVPADPGVGELREREVRLRADPSLELLGGGQVPDRRPVIAGRGGRGRPACGRTRPGTRRSTRSTRPAYGSSPR
jgi:hypothetical protein